MNGVEAFLHANSKRLALQDAGLPAPGTSLLRTPGFRTSSHVLWFVFAAGARQPCLVAKAPRLPHEHHFLDREAARLRAVQSARPGGFASIPRVLAYDDWCGTRLLVQSVIEGRTMNPAYVRRHAEPCLETALTWLVELHAATRAKSAADDLQRWVHVPLQRLEALFPADSLPGQLAEGTRRRADVDRLAELPCVFEHGDLGSPNILVDAAGRVGVVDWELAEPRGLPAADLFFFLNYVAAARARARRPEALLRAFHAAFFGPRAWTRPYVARYAEALQLDPATLPALFVLCWARYAVNVALRLYADRAASEGSPTLSAQGLQSDRYLVLWQHALAHAPELEF